MNIKQKNKYTMILEYFQFFIIGTLPISFIYPGINLPLKFNNIYFTFAVIFILSGVFLSLVCLIGVYFERKESVWSFYIRGIVGGISIPIMIVTIVLFGSHILHNPGLNDFPGISVLVGVFMLVLTFYFSQLWKSFMGESYTYNSHN